jgi:hypothetical protein
LRGVVDSKSEVGTENWKLPIAVIVTEADVLSTVLTGKVGAAQWGLTALLIVVIVIAAFVNICVPSVPLPVNWNVHVSVCAVPAKAPNVNRQMIEMMVPLVFMWMLPNPGPRFCPDYRQQHLQV